MEIKLDLSRHCLETECKKIYDRLISRYFRNKNKRTELEPTLEALGDFLEKTDFPALRSQYNELSGGYSHEATVFFHRDRAVIKLKEKNIALERQKETAFGELKTSRKIDSERPV